MCVLFYMLAMRFMHSNVSPHSDDEGLERLQLCPAVEKY